MPAELGPQNSHPADESARGMARVTSASRARRLPAEPAGNWSGKPRSVTGWNGGDPRWLFAGGAVKWRHAGAVAGLTGAFDGDVIPRR